MLRFDTPNTVQSYSIGYADSKCQEKKIPYVYIDTEDANRRQKDIADAVQFIFRTVSYLMRTW